MLDRKLLLNESKMLGLPACGKSEMLARKILIIKTDPRLWSKEDFEIIMPHLSIHQDLRAGSINRVESIMSDGLNHGMVDSLEHMVTVNIGLLDNVLEVRQPIFLLQDH